MIVKMSQSFSNGIWGVGICLNICVCVCVCVCVQRFIQDFGGFFGGEGETPKFSVDVERVYST